MLYMGIGKPMSPLQYEIFMSKYSWECYDVVCAVGRGFYQSSLACAAKTVADPIEAV